MGTTIDDIGYDRYMDDLWDSYTESLEKLANSKTLPELKNNLEELQGAKASFPDHLLDVSENKHFDELEEMLENITTLEAVYDTLIKSEKKSRFYFWVGTIIGAFGLILSVLSLLHIL